MKRDTQTLRATGTGSLLKRWAGYGSVRAEDKAITLSGFQNNSALLALVEPLTGIFGHNLGFLMPTYRTGDRRLQDDLFGHFPAPSDAQMVDTDFAKPFAAAVPIFLAPVILNGSDQRSKVKDKLSDSSLVTEAITHQLTAVGKPARHRRHNQ